MVKKTFPLCISCLFLFYYIDQWRIEDLPEGNGNSKDADANLIFVQYFSENCMKVVPLPLPPSRQYSNILKSNKKWNEIGSSFVNCAQHWMESFSEALYIIFRKYLKYLRNFTEKSNKSFSYTKVSLCELSGWEGLHWQITTLDNC